nr:MAG TPA: hypothetical protein [Caudoviricetes sp.]
MYGVFVGREYSFPCLTQTLVYKRNPRLLQ